MTGDPPPVMRLLRAAWRVATRQCRAAMAARMSGRRWRRPVVSCPPWCRQDHACSARHPGGEHRSPATTWLPPYGVLVATRTQRRDGVEHLELSLSVRLAGDEDLALAQGVHLPCAVDLTVRTVLAELEAASASRRVPDSRHDRIGS